MIKRLTALTTLIYATCIFDSYAQTESWECALNLHQGDTGSLTLKRTDESITGSIRISRNESDFDSDVSGQWVGDKIDLNRLVDSHTSEQMTGIASRVGTQQVKIGGRFAAGFLGVWSADCNRISVESKQLQSDAGEQAGQQVEVPPSISSRVSPNSPTEKDRLKFFALANHPDGIQSVTFYLADKKIHSCASSSCSFSHAALKAGRYQWRVEAISTSGSMSSESLDGLVVLDSKLTSGCNISGNADGFSSGQSPLFFVNLSGPDNAKLLRSTAGFKDNRYEFLDLPDGSYLLNVDTGADATVVATPFTASLTCRGGSNILQYFSFH